MPEPRWIEAELTWTGRRFESGVRVGVDAAGRIATVERTDAAPGAGAAIERLRRRALVPGFVNAHSHAFQRGLRGRGERYPAGSGTFWTWREAMYGLVRGLDGEGFRRLSLQAFREMRAAGITAVGEFHYFHHGPADGDFAHDPILLEAAAEADIRLVLLQAHYRCGGFGRPLEAGQSRFDTRSEERFWEQVDRLERALDPATQSLGIAAHSLRAVPLDEARALAAEARRRGLVFHVHLSEQRQEVEDCRAAHGLPPLALAVARLSPDARFTAVHGTHATAQELADYLDTGANLCLCPLTEASLADGLPALPEPPGPRAAGFCLGTDSNARISMLEEMRWLCYAQRLGRERRGVLRDAEGEVAPLLLSAASAGGARALGLDAGRIAPGAWADLVALDLDHPALEGYDADSLAAALVFGAPDGVVMASAVGGRWLQNA